MKQSDAALPDAGEGVTPGASKADMKRGYSNVSPGGELHDSPGPILEFDQPGGFVGRPMGWER
jgi:hypothetical protein